MLKAPPKQPYSGPFKVINLNLNDPMNYLMESIFINAPYSESWQDSTRRLLSAIRADGECELRPTTIWLAYRRHKELSEPIKPLKNHTQNGSQQAH